MKLSKFLQLLFVVTALSLIYIHMQMEIFNLAYQGKRKEKEIISISEDNGLLTYNILQLKSSNNLGDKLLSEDSTLQFCNNDQVIQLVTADKISEQQAIEEGKQKKPANPLLSFLSLRSQAIAQAQERTALARPWQRVRK